MLDAISNFLISFANLFPRILVVKANEKGVRFRRGKITKVIFPGVSWYWPLVTEIEIVPIVRQTLNLAAQTLMTKDGKCVIAAGVIVYSITDVIKYIVDNYDAEESIAEIASAALRDVIVEKSLDDIQTNSRNTTDKALSKCCKDALAIFGVSVEYARLTDFATARIINLVGATPVLPSVSEDE